MTRTYEAVRQKEEAWRRGQHHTFAETQHRVREILSRLGIGDPAAQATLNAAMQAARYFSMECAYANHELRTGCAYPSERREAEEAQEAAEWEACLRRLEEAVAR
jgi:dsRNA-specific ribonuclease